MVVGKGNHWILVTTRRKRKRAGDMTINSHMREREGRRGDIGW
jgi:hypothetical protein